MILLFNIFLTPGNLAHTYNRGLFSYNDDKIDVFKYCIESIAPIYDWSQVIINVKLDKIYESRQEELEQFLWNLFLAKSEINIGSRNEFQKDWQNTYGKLVEDDLIFYSCNHDHIFIDSQVEYFQNAITTFNKYSKEDSILYLSHYPETSLGFSKTKHNEFDGPLIYANQPCYDSFLILTKQLFKKWWFTYDLGDSYLPRSDYGPRHLGIIFEERGGLNPKFFNFSREVFRHYDGYNNITVSHARPNMNYFPPLRIPEGFFNNNIIINYNNGQKEGVSIDWSTKSYTTNNPNGSECFYLLEELPLVWRKHISQINNRLSPKIDFELNFHTRIAIIDDYLTYYCGKGTREYNYFLEQNEEFIKGLYTKRGVVRVSNPIPKQ